MNNIAIIILARKGSKRIIKKNIIDFRGKPLIEWTIEDALKLNYPHLGVYRYGRSKNNM